MSRLRTPEAQALAELAAVMAEGARLSRGRQYLRKRAVSDIDVESGVVTASVVGSRDDPYEVALSCRPATENEREATRTDLAEAVPGALDIAFDCHCPDWGDPCKHGVATLLAFAAEVEDDPSLLLLWRGISDVTPPPPTGTESLAVAAEQESVGQPKESRARAREGAAVVAVHSPGDEIEVSEQPQTREGGQLSEFFAGKMPGEATALLQPLEEVQLDSFGRARIPIENVDMAPVFADAIEVIADHWLAH